MSKKHLDHLLELLYDNKWEFQDETEDIFMVKDDKIEWEIIDEYYPIKTNKITFYLFDGLGRRTKDLNDISYCKSDSNDEILFFDKINSEDWKVNSMKWVKNLRQP